MLKIHKPFSKHKLLLTLITSICITFGLLGLYYLTYTPELSHAEQVTYPSLSNITYMQDMTVDICKHSHENETKQLIDSRDGKTYWVAKLKDGNCWMTQNLDLGIPAEGLKAEDTDIEVDWNSITNPTYAPVATQTGNPSSFSGNNDINSYDPGEFVYTTPIALNNCGTVIKIESCRNWIKVAGLSTSSSDDERAHYLVGNYYSWAAAIAGQVATLTSTTVGEQSTQSICPKGWTLPTSGDGKQFAMLTNGLNASVTVTANNLKLAPYYFVYNGGANSNSLENVGERGHYWSSTAGDRFNAYSLYFNTGVNPSSYDGRHYGFSIRCIARNDTVLNENVKININPQISLDVAEEVVVEKGEVNPSTADLSVKVSSNQPYSVNINAREHAELVSENGDKILSNGGALTTAENNWGIMKPGDTIYTKITTSPELFYQATSPEVKELLLKVGISTAPDLPSGEYSTDITITATQN